MASVQIYDNAKLKIDEAAMNFSADTFRLILVTSTYTPSVPTDATYANVSADEATGTGYTAGGQALTGVSLVYGATALPTIGAGGSGYAVSATFTVTVSGGTSTTAAQVSVTTNASGVVTTINSVVVVGSYTVLPTNPAATTGGTGTGLTLAMVWGVLVEAATVTWTTATISAKYAVVVHQAGGSLASTDLLVGYVDLNPGGGNISSTAGNFVVTWSGGDIFSTT